MRSGSRIDTLFWKRRGEIPIYSIFFPIAIYQVWWNLIFNTKFFSAFQEFHDQWYIPSFYFWILINQCDYVENKKCYWFAWYNELPFKKRKVLPVISFDFSGALTSWGGRDVFCHNYNVQEGYVALQWLLYPEEGCVSKEVSVTSGLSENWVKHPFPQAFHSWSPISFFWEVKVMKSFQLLPASSTNCSMALTLILAE